MALRIVKSTDPITIDRINVCIYAPPGVGKTTMAFTADEPILLDTDRGSHRAGKRRDVVQVNNWAEIADITADDLAPYKTVILDTAGRALDFLTADIIKSDPKMGRGGGELTLPGFGRLKSRFSTWLKSLNTLGKDIVLVAHMDEQRSGDNVIERLDVQGGSKNEIYKSVDAMGRIFIVNKKRVIDFSPRENSFGKNPANLEVLDVPDIHKNDHFLGDVIRQIKDHINRQSEEQIKAQQQMEEWTAAIHDFSTVDEFNRNLADIKKLPKAIQATFAGRAKELSFTFDKHSGMYLAPTPVVEPVAEQIPF